MRSFWSDPYLWIHLSGIAAVPIFLELCLLGFAIGDPILPGWLELLVVATVGVAPILWMQLQRPFYIFSLIAVVLKPQQLTEDQRRLLTLFKSQRNQILAIVVPILLFFVLLQVYQTAPLAPLSSGLRIIGILLSSAAFLAVNLFTQVPASVLSAMLNSDTKFAATSPYPTAQIPQAFSLIGLQVNQILPPITAAVPPEPITASAPFELSAVESVPHISSTKTDEVEQNTDTSLKADEPVPPFSTDLTSSEALTTPSANQELETSVSTEPSSSTDTENSSSTPAEDDVWGL